MSRGLIVSLAQDYVFAAKIATSTSSAAQVFTPADGPATSFNGKPCALVSDEVILHNTDATNGIWVRFATLANETAAQGIASAAAGQSGSGPQQQSSAPPSVDSTKFIAATTGTKGELFVPPATQYVVRVKAVGFTYIAVASTPTLNVCAVGANNLV
jgi:hypothetical protein